MVKLPPDDSDDLTPSENFILTVDVSELATVDIGNHSTDLVNAGRVDVHTLVRARQGARAQAFEECRRTCKARWPARAYGHVVAFCKRHARGFLVGALVAVALYAMAAAFSYCLKAWR